MSNSTPRAGIIGWFAGNPVAANLLMLLVISLGIMSASGLRKEAFPSLEPSEISISVSYNSGDAELSEEGVAIKIEQQLEGVSGIKSITSTSSANSVSISIEKQSKTDLDDLMQRVKAKVDAISNFPEDADQPVIEKAQRSEHALWIQLSGADRHTLQSLGENLKQDLLAEANISTVSYSGWLDPLMAIEIDEGKLQAYGLSLSDVEDAVNQASTTAQTAVLSNSSSYLQLKASEQAYTRQDFEQLPLITTSTGTRIELGDVATVRDTFEDESSSLSRFNGQPSLGLQVISGDEDDISDSVIAAKSVIEAWNAQAKLPQGVELVSWYDRSTMINERLQLLVKNAVTGIAFVFALLALFLNLRVAIWVAAGLPFIFFGTLFLMGDNLMGLTLNEFTTFGFIMALGIVVDDAVVVGESIYSERRRYGDTLANTISGTMKVAVPTLFGVFTTVAAFASLSQIEGHLGQLYAQFAAIVAICLVLSVIESKLILPAHLSHLPTHRNPKGNSIAGYWQRIQQGADRGFVFFNERIYHPLINGTLRYRYAAVVLFIALLMLVLSMPLTGTVRMSFFPDITGDTVRASINMRNDATQGQNQRAILQLEQSAYETDRLLTQTTDADAQPSGISDLQLVASGNSSSSLRIKLKPDAPYTNREFARRWREIAPMPEAVKTVNIQSARRMVDALRIELKANDDKLLHQAGEELKNRLSAIPAVSGIEDSLTPGQPQLYLSLNAQGEALGLTTQMLAQQVLQGFSGQVVQRYQRNNNEIEVKVRYPEAARQSAGDVYNANIRTSDGQVIPLTSVADLTFGFTRTTIQRIDGQRAVYLSAEVNKNQLSSTELVQQLRTELVPQLQREYPGLSVHFGGEAEQQEETENSMLQLFAIAMLIIYMLLAIPLKSYVQPILIMTAIPFGIVGAILGHWLNDIPLGILSFNGILALSGVVVNDSLLLVARFNNLKDRFDTIEEAISHACQDRLRAVLLTSFTTFAGLMPLLNETSTQAQFLIPAAVSLAYGIMFATVITLMLIPVLLMIQHDVIGLGSRLLPKKPVAESETVNEAS